jgi:hypothetical protein
LFVGEKRAKRFRYVSRSRKRQRIAGAEPGAVNYAVHAKANRAGGRDALHVWGLSLPVFFVCALCVERRFSFLQISLNRFHLAGAFAQAAAARNFIVRQFLIHRGFTTNERAGALARTKRGARKEAAPNLESGRYEHTTFTNA